MKTANIPLLSFSFPETMGETTPMPGRRDPKPWETEPDIPEPHVPDDPGDVPAPDDPADVPPIDNRGWLT